MKLHENYCILNSKKISTLRRSFFKFVSISSYYSIFHLQNDKSYPYSQRGFKTLKLDFLLTSNTKILEFGKLRFTYLAYHKQLLDE
jgi:hypothetical protein